MKKDYIKPEQQLVMLQYSHQLLSDSITEVIGDDIAITIGGGSDDPARAPLYEVLDDWGE